MSSCIEVSTSNRWMSVGKLPLLGLTKLKLCFVVFILCVGCHGRLWCPPATPSLPPSLLVSWSEAHCLVYIYLAHMGRGVWGTLSYGHGKIYT